MKSIAGYVIEIIFLFCRFWKVVSVLRLLDDINRYIGKLVVVWIGRGENGCRKRS